MFETLASEASGAITAADVLARAASERSAADAAEARLLTAAAEWADLHPPESIDHAATFGVAVPGSEHEERIAGHGCPLVAEFCIPELAAALAMSTTASGPTAAGATGWSPPVSTSGPAHTATATTPAPDNNPAPDPTRPRWGHPRARSLSA